MVDLSFGARGVRAPEEEMREMATTKIASGSVQAGQVIRLANRPKDFRWDAAWLTVTEKPTMKSAPRRKDYTIRGTIGGGEQVIEYGTFSHAVRFELQPEKPVKAARTQTGGERKPRVRTSLALRSALQRLAQTELGETPEQDGKTGGMTRADLHADPMVVVALANRGWATVERTEETTRGADFIELTAAGREAAREMGYFSAK